MKNKNLLIITSCLAIAAGSASAGTYQWNGTTSDWQTATNWSSTTTAPFNNLGSVPVFGGTSANRLNVNGATALVYDSTLGTTVYANTGAGLRGLVIGSGAGGSGTMTITGGTFSTAGSNTADLIGNSDNNTGTLNISGGNYIGTAAGTSLGAGAAGAGATRVSTLNVNSGTATVATLSVNTTTANINLNGGTLAMNGQDFPVSAATPCSLNINFDGGTVKARTNNSNFFADPLATNYTTTIKVKSKGAIIDSDTFAITIARNILTDGASLGGGLTKQGSGTLTLSGTANTYTGATTIKAGTLGLSSTSTIATSSTIVVGDAGSSGTVLDVTAKTSFVIGSTQTLKGIGNINIGAGKTVTINGTLAAGNSIGTNSVTGNLTLAGTTQIELGTTGASQAAPGASDRTNVSGALVLGGGLTVINNAGADGNGSIGAGSYKIFTQTGTASGSFSSITNIAGYHAKVDTATSGSVFLDNYALATTGTIAAVNLGKARVGGSFSGSGALSVSNSTAANNGFTEGLNATQGAVTGGVIAGGSNVSNLAGASSSTSLTAGFSTATSGAKSGTTTINLASSGTNSGYANTSLTSQTVGVTGNVYDYATALFSKTAGDGSLTGGGTSYTLDFGAALALSTYYTATLQLANGTIFNAFQDNLGGSYTTGGASEFSNTAASFGNLVSNGNNSFTVTFFTGSMGTFNGTLDFAGLSQQAGLADANLANINIAFTGTAVPEPNVAALLGCLGTLTLLRRRRA